MTLSPFLHPPRPGRQRSDSLDTEHLPRFREIGDIRVGVGVPRWFSSVSNSSIRLGSIVSAERQTKQMVISRKLALCGQR